MDMDAAAAPKLLVQGMRRRSPKLHACSLPREGSAALAAGRITCEGLHGKERGRRVNRHRAT